MNPDSNKQQGSASPAPTPALLPAEPKLPELPKPQAPDLPAASEAAAVAPGVVGETMAPAPVVSAIGEIAAQPEVDGSAITPPVEKQTTESALAAAPTATANVPDASTTNNQQPASSDHNDRADQNAKIPIPPTLLPAFAIGILILFLLLAVVLYAFVA